jgi:hypothetical protein
MVVEPDAELEHFKDYISQVHWRFARTYAKTFPHEYTSKDWRPDLKDRFERVVTFIRERGQPERFFRKTYIYFYHDGFKYWTMGDTLPHTIIINRCPVNQT